jgi:hypothetical protein
MPASKFPAARPVMWLPLGLLLCALAAAPALAQAAPPDDSTDAAQSPDMSDQALPDQALPDQVLPDDLALGDALTFDPSKLVVAGPAKPLRLPGLANGKSFEVTRADRPDGSSTVTLKDSLSSDWDAKVGADIGLAATPPTTFWSEQPLPTTLGDRGSGAAWASVGLPNLASIDARLDPSNEQSRLGTTLKHAMPLGSSLSVTLQDRLSLTQALGTPAVTAPTALVMAAPPPPPAVAPPAQIWSDQKLVKFDILPTGTSVSAGVASSSIDPVTHNTLSADQKLLGPLHVTTAVTDVGQPTVSKSVSAGLKLTW